jgi:pyruvate/2-oxoglutarate dehydrogenase complex dihydrolipoamide dehydrogenase (E3) component
LLPPIEGLGQIDGAWTNREATTVSAIPRRLVIVGGGPVGSRMAQAFQTLGSQVTLIEGERRLLPHEEEFACAQITAALQAFGVNVRIGQKAIKVARPGSDGGVVVLMSERGGTAEGDELLIALGRTYPTTDLGIETVGLTPGEPVRVDAQMRVPGAPWLYAVGDINGRALYTHMGKYQARIATDGLSVTSTRWP